MKKTGHDFENIYGENVEQSDGTNIEQSDGDDIERNGGENIKQNDGEDIKQNDEEEIGQSDREDIEKMTEKTLNKVTEKGIEQYDGENIDNTNIEHKDQRVNGHSANVDEILQNMETDEEVDGINSNALPNEIWQGILTAVLQLCDFTDDEHVCFTFNKFCKVSKRFNDMAWRCVDELP